MLVLARKLNESIVIGDNITLKVISIDKGIVKLGIDAPRDISIIRNELLLEVKESNLASAVEVDTDSIGALSKLIGK
ncbi:carbon storage regulator CsrA [Sulfurimonas sp. SAG-AH-194-I05]|nr:carbon storage regulator CsrA [Sulfurimonas sp. SAG-AH-194-I05]MDF1874927.1 carbon storage regulator CsrA [Sulfurimonas sp. SAG-AH-194-I05]